MADGAQDEILALLQPLTPMQQRLFACDCAAHVLPLFERIFPHDDRPRTAIAVARAYAHGQVSAIALAEAEATAEAVVWEASDAASICNPNDEAALITWNAAAPAACAAEACCVLDLAIMLIGILSITIEAVVSAHFTTDALEEIWNRAGRPVPPDVLAQYHHYATMERAWQHQRAMFYAAQTHNHPPDPA